MKNNKSFNKIVAATFIASAFMACSDDNDTPIFVGTPYEANTSSIASAGTAVDLGLSVKWADKNVGAASAKDMGLSFIWGDVTGTQTSATAATYGQGSKVDMKPYFDMFKKQDADPEKDAKECVKVDVARVQVSKQDYKVEAVDSIRPNYSYQILIKRTADVKVKNPDGTWKMDADTIVRETKVFVEIDSLILMGYDGETAFKNKEAFLKPYREDKYNKYTIEKHDSVYSTDIVKKLVPAAGEKSIADVISETQKNTGKSQVYCTFTNGVMNESDSHLHADLIVEVNDTITYREKNWALDELPALTIIGDANLDAATKNWGNDWAMPTSDQLKELVEKCEWSYEGNGYTVTGPNGNSIFLPAAGYRYESNVVGQGAVGYYASGEVYGKYTYPSGPEQMAGSYGTAAAYSTPNIMIFNYGQFDNSKKITNVLEEKNIGISIRPVAKSK